MLAPQTPAAPTAETFFFHISGTQRAGKFDPVQPNVRPWLGGVQGAHGGGAPEVQSDRARARLAGDHPKVSVCSGGRGIVRAARLRERDALAFLLFVVDPRNRLSTLYLVYSFLVLLRW